MRREKRRSAALLGHSGPRSTGVRLRSSFGRSLHLTTFDDAMVDSRKFIQSGKVSPGASGWGAGLQGHLAKVGLLGCSRGDFLQVQYADVCRDAGF